MLLEIAQIKKYLAKVHNLPLENHESLGMIRVVGHVPDGDYVIPLGESETPFHVSITEGKIHIKDKADDPCHHRVAGLDRRG